MPTVSALSTGMCSFRLCVPMAGRGRNGPAVSRSLGRGQWGPEKLGILQWSLHMFLWGQGKADEDETTLPGESAPSFHFPVSLFSYPCYCSQGPGSRKHIFSFLSHMSSIPTVEKEALLFPWRTFSLHPKRSVIWVAKGTNTTTHTHKICLKRIFSIHPMAKLSTNHSFPFVYVFVHTYAINYYNASNKNNYQAVNIKLLILLLIYWNQETYFRERRRMGSEGRESQSLFWMSKLPAGG